MTKGTQLWPNERMRAFFLAHIRRETALDGAAAERLTDALLKSVNRMLVWDMPEPAAMKAAAAASPQAKPKGKAAGAPVAGPRAEAARQGVPLPSGSKFSSHGDSKTAAATGQGFDPYAYSATVVLAKTGREGLMKRLLDIKSAENLKAFADAQHLGIDRKISKADDLRKAILTATEQRLADRKAAAS